MSKILNLPMEENDANAATIREFLIALLMELWREGDNFSAKRPWGNSGWSGDIEIALVRAGVIVGKIDEHGYLEECDSAGAARLIEEAILELGKTS